MLESGKSFTNPNALQKRTAANRSSTIHRPLLPSACHTAELRFIALATGVLNVEGVRVVDLVTNETTDCRDLPSIVSMGKR